MAKGGMKAERPADEAVVYHQSGHHMGRCKALVVPQHQALAVGLRGIHHRLALRKGSGHRLLAQHMLACKQRVNAHPGMRVVGHAHADNIDLLIGQHLLNAVIGFAAKQAHHELRAAWVLVIVTQDQGIRILGIFRAVAHFRYFAAADYACLKHLHTSPFLLGASRIILYLLRKGFVNCCFNLTR